jgi:ATP-binding cassette subfamily B protein
MRRRTPSRFRQLFVANLREVRGRLLFAGICTLGATAAELLKPWPLKVILDHVILDKPIRPALRALHGLLAQGKMPLLFEASAAIVVIALAGGLFSYFQIFITSSIGYKMVYALRRELFTHLQTLSLAFHNRARSGDLLTKIAGDTNTLKDVFADSILKFTSYVLTVVGMLAIMVAIDWKVGLIALATLPFLGYSLLHLYRKTKLSVKTQKKQEGQVASRMSEVLQAVPLVQAFARQRN